ncbi:MAG: hypothetical protein AB4352_18050 [Hormoscilla sp.]
MNSEFILSQYTLTEQFCDIYSAGRISKADLQQWELARDSTLSDEEASLVTRLFHAVKRGWLKVIEG